MGYQVLARKWRPKNFHQLIGQEQTSRALINALNTNRLHHAYLFTGTRGVGKTTIARILAKCLNCETGVTSQPCDACSSCQAIDAGRFVDLIEVDAASRTKVEDTRELLDNVQYAPVQGRYKVYLIDEVHMLSGHSFNALLKTLEEPPEHVKFLLATTDPQKLPVTVLSRCLQFQLRNMPAEKVVEHLEHILSEEGAEFDLGALSLLGKAADGSMRDGLSLTEQALAYGQGKLTTADVANLLGVLDQNHLLKLLHALVNQNAAQLLAEVNQLAELAPDFASILQDLASLLHQLTLAQFVPAALANDLVNREEILQLASQLTAEEVQLYYQLAIEGKRDLPLAPEPKAGLEMALLRMLAFKPQGIPQPPTTPLVPTGNNTPASNPGSGAASTPNSGQTAAPANPVTANSTTPVIDDSTTPVIASEAKQASEQAPKVSHEPTSRVPPWEEEPAATSVIASAAKQSSEPVAPIQEASEPVSQDAQALTTNEDWLNLAPQLEIGGWQASQMRQLSLTQAENNLLEFAAPAQALGFLDAKFEEVLTAEIERLTGLANVKLTFNSDNPQGLENLNQRKENTKQAELTACQEAFLATPEVQLLHQYFQAELTQVTPASWQSSSLH